MGIVNLVVRRGGWDDRQVALEVRRGWLVGTETPSYRGSRFPVEIINHGVWLYYRFPLSFREVQEMKLQRGVVVFHETIRQWCVKFGQTYANGLRRRRPCPGDKWHLDEVFLTINGQRQYLWRAVDQDGTVLDIHLKAKPFLLSVAVNGTPANTERISEMLAPLRDNLPNMLIYHKSGYSWG
jgi:hypothetical protein